MSKDLHSTIKVGIVQFMAYPSTIAGEGPILETISKIAKDDFFGAIEVTRINDAEIRKQVASVLEQSRMTVGFGCQPVQLMGKLNLNSFDSQERGHAITVIKDLLPQAHELGAKKLAVLSGPDPGVEKRASAIDLLVESLIDICKVASEKYGIDVVMEVFDRDIDKKCLIGSTADAVKVSEAVRRTCPNFGLMIDLSHLPLKGETAIQSLTLAKDHLVHVHIGNCVLNDNSNPAFGDQHPRFGFPGGEVDVQELTEFLRVLRNIGYLNDDGDLKVVAFEVKPTPGEDSDLIVANAKRTLREAWAKV